MTPENLKKATLIAIKRPHHPPPVEYADDEFSFTILLHGDTETPLFYEHLWIEPIGSFVDWGDGTSEITTAWDNSHQYAEPGAYTIFIKGIVYYGLEVIDVKTRSKSLIAINSKYPLFHSALHINNTAYSENLIIVPNDLFSSIAGSSTADGMEAFYGCKKLVAIPNGIFSGFSQVTDYQSAFYGCENIKEIPVGLFAGCICAEDFEWCFQGCTGLTEIPAGLFADNIYANTFQGCFRGCTGLTEAPGGVFPAVSTHVNLTSCFRDCTGITSISSDLFHGLSDVDLWYMFRDCTALTSLPEDLLDELSAIEMYGTFYGCTGLSQIPDDFIPSTGVTDLRFCFASCTGITGNVPRLWETHQDVPHYRCFHRCTNAANYAEIPSDWKD